MRRGADDVFIDLEELLRIVYHPKTRPEIQHAFCSHLANFLGSEDEPVTAGPGPNFLDAMVAQQAKDSPSEFLAALQEVAGESLELTHRLREIFGSREDIVEAPRCKRQRVEEFWDKVFELFGKDLPQAIRGVAEAFQRLEGSGRDAEDDVEELDSDSDDDDVSFGVPIVEEPVTLATAHADLAEKGPASVTSGSLDQLCFGSQKLSVDRLEISTTHGHFSYIFQRPGSAVKCRILIPPKTIESAYYDGRRFTLSVVVRDVSKPFFWRQIMVRRKTGDSAADWARVPVDDVTGGLASTSRTITVHAKSTSGLSKVVSYLQALKNVPACTKLTIHNGTAPPGVLAYRYSADTPAGSVAAAQHHVRGDAHAINARTHAAEVKTSLRAIERFRTGRLTYLSMNTSAAQKIADLAEGKKWLKRVRADLRQVVASFKASIGSTS